MNIQNPFVENGYGNMSLYYPLYPPTRFAFARSCFCIPERDRTSSSNTTKQTATSEAVRQTRVLACLLAYLPAYLPTYLPACLPACLPAYLSIHDDGPAIIRVLIDFSLRDMHIIHIISIISITIIIMISFIVIMIIDIIIIVTMMMMQIMFINSVIVCIIIITIIYHALCWGDREVRLRRRLLALTSAATPGSGSSRYRAKGI